MIVGESSRHDSRFIYFYSLTHIQGGSPSIKEAQSCIIVMPNFILEMKIIPLRHKLIIYTYFENTDVPT